MPNKTIYVSDADSSLFEEAKTIAGEALSSVIVRALREFVSRYQEKAKGMKEVSVKVGKHDAEREQRFVGAWVKDWSGFSDDKDWWLSAKIYKTQKGNWAVYLQHISKASLLTNRKQWKASGDYLVNPKEAELLVAPTPEGFGNKLPDALKTLIHSLLQQEEKPIEFLDI